MMKCAALTGISPEILRDLKSGRPRTLELESTHNVVTVAEISPGDHIFLTSVDRNDLSQGDAGIIVETLAVGINMKRTVGYISGVHFEERERLSARVQVRYCGTSMVKTVELEGLCQPSQVEISKSTCYHAG
ncbi:MAG: DUF473 domain-containing protein [Methanoregulaceae archaeon]